MSIPVAIEKDTKVITSSKKIPADRNGTGRWVEGSLSVKQGKNISVNGKRIELSAEMTWDYVDGSSGNPPVKIGNVEDSATLHAAVTKLKDTGEDVLLHGDEATGSIDSDNKIIVSVEQAILKTHLM